MLKMHIFILWKLFNSFFFFVILFCYFLNKKVLIKTIILQIQNFIKKKYLNKLIKFTQFRLYK